MAIAFANKGAVNGVAGSPVDVAYPSNISENDILLLQVINFDGSAAITTPSGWTELYKTSKVSSTVQGFYIKRATGSESGDLSVTTGGGLASYGVMSRWTGVTTDATFFEDVTGTSTVTSTTATSQAITSTGANHLAITMVNIHDNISIGTWSDSYVEDFDVNSSLRFDTAWEIASQLKVTAGEVASETSTLGASDNHALCTLFLIPEGAAPIIVIKKNNIVMII